MLIRIITASATDGGDQVELNLELTGGEDRALYLRIETLSLQRTAADWQIVQRRIVGGGF